ncbi:MAG: tRNA dihydrouridine synthase DusB [Smithellaceae bacterium]
MSGLINAMGSKVLFAPLAGITNLPYRLIARQFGCGLCFTEMVSANGLIRESDKTLHYLTTCPDDRPLGVQLFGADPAIVAEAAQVVARRKPDCIDINMGCPVRKVVKTGSGAALMKSPLLAGRIIAAVVKAVSVPVTVKIRAGWTRASVNALELARIAEDEGARAVTVHGRTADQGFSGHADWEIIARVKQAVRISVIGNGDIWQAKDAVRMLAETGCDAVMVGRGALGNPWLFEGIGQLLACGETPAGPTLAQRHEIIKKHWEMETDFYGRRLADKTFRKHLLWYTKGLAGSGRFRETVGKMKDQQAMLTELDRYFSSLHDLSAEIMT